MALNSAGTLLIKWLLIALAFGAVELLLIFIKRGREFLRQAFSEDDGRASFGRLSFGAVIAGVLFYIVFQTLHARAIEWNAIGIFLGAAGAVTYASNKFATAISK